MNDKTILLNGGRALDVTPVDGADQFLAQLLGAAPSRPAIPTLRLVDDPTGARCVGVFVGNTHVGYLLNDVDEGLVATLQACEHHGAVARARATLMAAWEDPEMAVLKVDLADSDQLLAEAGPGSPHPDAPEVEPHAEPSSPVPQASFAAPQESFAAPQEPMEPRDILPNDDYWPGRDLAATPADEPATAESAGLLGNDSAPGLAAGYNEDYPDWPPKNSQASPAFETARAPAGPPTPAESPAQADDSLAMPLDPAPAPSSATPTASPQAPLSTRSVWFGTMPMPEVPPQAGWLAAAPQRPTTGQPDLSAQSVAAGRTSPPRATGWLGGQQPAASKEGAAMATAPAPSAQAESWQDHADGPRDPESQFVTGWTSGAAQTRPVTEIKRAGMSDKAKAWLVGVLAVAVMTTAGFLVWKTQFAPKTYTDDQYGYSFSYPGRWQFEDESGMPPFASLATFGADDLILDFAAAGHGYSAPTTWRLPTGERSARAPTGWPPIWSQ